jgi:hypothetical protein
MENINFFLKEQDNDVSTNKLLIEELNTFTNEFTCNNSIEELEIQYKLNYTIKSLTHILHYYNIYKSKMTKDEMIQVLLFFETDPANKEIVQHRLRLWKNIEELKNDSYFSKYILF